MARQVDQVARDWLQKYGERIDCPELQAIASRTVVDRQRYAFAVSRQLEAGANVVRELRRRLNKFLNEPVPGTQVSLNQLAEVSLVVPHVDRARGLDPNVPDAAPFPAAWTKLTNLPMQLAVFESNLRNAAAEARGQKPPPGFDFSVLRPKKLKQHASARGRAPDPAFQCVCYGVSEWIRHRHRDKRGKLDRRTSWKDVETCLEWYGHDLQQVDKAGACREAARRHRQTSTRLTKQRPDP